MKKIYTLILFLITIIVVNAQDFEGTITYKIEIKKPSVQISDTLWKYKTREYFGNKNGFIFNKYFYKRDFYKSECDHKDTKQIQLYNSGDGQLYSWIEGKSDTIRTIETKQNTDEFFDALPSDKVAIVLNIPCKSIIIKTRYNKYTVYYNSNYLKIDPKSFKGHVFNQLDPIVKNIGCLPLKIEQFGEIGQVVQTAIIIDEKTVDDYEFNFPAYNVILKSDGEIQEETKNPE